MVIAEVRWRFSEPQSRDDVQDLIEKSAAAWVGRPGLRHKYYVVTDDPAQAVGFYVWDTREQAEAAYGQEFADRIATLFGGSDLQVTFHEVVGSLDASGGELILPGRPTVEVGGRS